MKPIILFRESMTLDDVDTKQELILAKKYFDVTPHRSCIPEGSLVIGRYSVLPYYRELEQEIEIRKSKLANTYDQHSYLADIEAYYQDIRDFTPATYTTWGHIDSGEWVLKGKTNSRKFRWNTHMYANGREQLLAVARRLMDDMFISEQGIVVREYIPLKKIDEGINGLPITREWRCFYWGEQLVSSGFYWASHFEQYENIPAEGLELANHVAKIVSKKAQFFVMDIAEKQSGGFIVIELNDSQMSGLSLCDPDGLYGNLKEIID